MLAGKQRGRHHHGDLLAGQHGDQARAERHLGLAEADIAADQPVHRPAAGEIAEHGADARLLVLGLLVRESGGELVIDAVRRVEHRRLAQLAQSRDLDQLLGHVADALLEPGFARLPGDAAQPVELHARLVGAVAGEHLDILDRQIELVAAGIVHFEAIMRLAGRLDGGKPDEAADAVVGMHHEIADREARDFGQHVVSALAAALADEAVAENVLLVDHREPRRLEAGLERQNGHGRHVARLAQDVGEALHPLGLADAVLGQKRRQPLARAVAPAGDDHALALAAQPLGMSHHGIEHGDAFGLPLGREGPALPAAERHDARRLGLLERIERNDLAACKRRLPVRLAQEHAVGRHGVIRRRAEGLALERLRARVVMVGDLLEPALARIVEQRIERDAGFGQIVEQRDQAIVEQRQPMLHALMLAPRRDRLVERVVAGDRTEQSDITLAEGADDLGRQRHLAHRQELHRLRAAPRSAACRGRRP